MANTQPPPDFFCSDLSRTADEEMAGTAVHATIWFLLEYAGPWRARATDDNDLAEPVQTWLSGLVAGVDNGRVQFIKQPARASELDVRFFVAVLNGQMPRLYEFTAETYEDLFAIDVAAAVGGDPSYDDHLRTDPLYLVCTNGKRDRCCALHGLAFAHALTAAAGDAVWQTTHLGGHRFAATLLSLPDGVCYGRLALADAADFLDHHQRGALWLDKMRGFTGYDTVTQLAEIVLRRETGERDRRHYRHLQTVASQDSWQVGFVDVGKRPLAVTLAAAKPLQLVASCGSAKAKTVPQYRLLNIVS